MRHPASLPGGAHSARCQRSRKTYPDFHRLSVRPESHKICGAYFLQTFAACAFHQPAIYTAKFALVFSQFPECSNVSAVANSRCTLRVRFALHMRVPIHVVCVTLRAIIMVVQVVGCDGPDRVLERLRHCKRCTCRTTDIAQKINFCPRRVGATRNFFDWRHARPSRPSRP